MIRFGVARSLGLILVPAMAGATPLPPSSGGAGDLDRAVVALKTAERAVASRTASDDGFALDDAPGSMALLENQWRSARRWTADWLAAHPGTTDAALAAAARRDVAFDFSVARLDDATLLMSGTIGALGTAFILRRTTGGRFVTALALDEPGTWRGRGPAELAAWRSDRANSSCRSRRAETAWAQCGPLAPEAVTLPAEAGGASRFAVIGRYVKAMGATDGYQLSIWRWTGRAAEPLLLRGFDQMAEEPIVTAVTPHALTIHVKGDLKRMLACGSCSGRQMELVFDLPSRGARLTTVRSLTPALDLIDTLYDRLFRLQPVNDLATPAAVSQIQPTVRAQRDQARRDKFAPSLGLLGSWKLIRPDARGATLCLDTDALDKPQLFAIEARGGRSLITSVRAGATAACEGPDSHS